MPTTDTSEKGLETLIFESLVNEAGYAAGDSKDFDRDYAVDLAKLLSFLQTTQPKAVALLALDAEGSRRNQFLARLQGEITKRGIVDVLRKGVDHGPAHVDLFYGTPSAENAKAVERFGQNIFSVTRQLHYSRDESKLSLDLCVFLNGLPLATFELKNRLTKQTVADAVEQYKRDREPNELLFQFKRTMAHFAVDDQEVRFCTQLQGKDSWFLPFNKGYRDGAGNPPNPEGLKTDYLWRETLTKAGLTEILENYAQVIERRDAKTGKVSRSLVFPRYHQLDVVRKLLADAAEKGAGQRYLIQHSAGSGKSNSIAWLAHQLVGLRSDKSGQAEAPAPLKEDRQARAPIVHDVFDSVVVVTDRRVLDKQIRDTIRDFAQGRHLVGHAENSGDLRRFIAEGKKIVITTVQKFPFVLDEIGSEHRGRKFAIIIDEAHSSQGGRAAAQMNMALSASGEEQVEETAEDAINRLMETRKMLPNASYFAFTATPKNKTLEVFGTASSGEHRRAFHSYTMKQAIQEGFILDVLQNYTPVDSYYRLMTTVEDDPEFDVKKANKKLRRYVEGNEHAIRVKAEIMVDHFHEQVLAKKKIGGEARAMVVTGSIERALEYFLAFQAYLAERKSPYRAIVAFSGEPEFKGRKVSEAGMNAFAGSQIPDRIKETPYRFLICADKFQTGYDEPLLHTMYVDKALSGIKAVQTLSRLNRAHPKKHDTFVLDFQNSVDTIREAFQDYYQTTVLSGETDPNRLHDLKADLDARQVYALEDVERLVELYVGGAPREKLDPILDACVAAYRETLDEDGQVDFKGKAKTFVRTYGFLASILPFSNAGWEKLSIFLNFLIPKLPAPVEEDLSKGILESIDMESYRPEVRAAMALALADQDAEIEPAPTGGGGRKPEPELDRLSNIVREFNELYGNIDWKDGDRIRKAISEEIPAKVAADEAYRNAMKNSDKQNARIEHDQVLGRVIVDMMTDHTELFKQFFDNPGFRKWLGDRVFGATYEGGSRRAAV